MLPMTSSSKTSFASHIFNALSRNPIDDPVDEIACGVDDTHSPFGVCGHIMQDHFLDEGAFAETGVPGDVESLGAGAAGKDCLSRHLFCGPNLSRRQGSRVDKAYLVRLEYCHPRSVRQPHLRNLRPGDRSDTTI